MKATVILFRRSGKYYTEEQWEIPQEPWGYPHLLGLP